MAIQPELRRTMTTMALMLALSAAAGCGDGASRDGVASQAGDVDLAMLPVEAEALAAIEHPVDFQLGEERLEQLLTARERLRQVKTAAAESALALDVRRAPLGESGDALGTLVDGLQKDADTRRAIEGSGLSTRDYVSGMFALQQAVLARGVETRGALPPVMLANMQVVERNQDRVAQLTERTSFASVLEARAWEGTTADESMLTGLSPSRTAAGAMGPATSRTGAEAVERPAEAAIWHTGGQTGARVSVREMERRKKEAKKREKEAKKREKERRKRGQDD